MTTYRVPSGLAHVVPEGQPEPPPLVFLMRLPDGEPLALEQSAAWIWLVAAQGGQDVAGVVGRLVRRPRLEIESHVEEFLGDLVRRGLLDISP